MNTRACSRKRKPLQERRKGAVMKFNKYTGKYMPEDSDFDSPVFAVMFGIGLVAVIVVFIFAACSVFK
jgi:hypothetical protein